MMNFDHIEQPYSIEEIESKLASNDFCAELMLYHAMIQLRALVSATQWKPISTAPKDRVILVNDTTYDNASLWVAASWLDVHDWSGWIYDDDLLNDANPYGPQPTHWFNVPVLPR